MSKDSIDVSTENLPPTESLAVTSKDEIDVHATTDDATGRSNFIDLQNYHSILEFIFYS